jgi:hypothetical protein
VERDSHTIEHAGFGPRQAEDASVLGEQQWAEHARANVVIAEEQYDLAPGVAQAQELVNQVEADSVVTAPAVDDVTRTDEKLCALAEAKVHERSERESVRRRHAFGDVLVHGRRSKPSPASEVEVGGVDEAEVGGRRRHSARRVRARGAMRSVVLCPRSVAHQAGGQDDG